MAVVEKGSFVNLAAVKEYRSVGLVKWCAKDHGGLCGTMVLPRARRQGLRCGTRLGHEIDT